MDSQFWNDEFMGNPEFVDVADQVLASELDTLEPGRAPKPGRALDLGCGSGRNALMLAKRGWSTVGVDWAAHAIGLAERDAAAQALDATFIVGDTKTWRGDATFELVISTYALPGGEDNQHVLATAADSVAPGGTLIIAEWDRSMAEVWPFEKEDLTTPEELVASLPGFEIERAEVLRLEVFSARDPRAFAGTWANVILLRARRPPS